MCCERRESAKGKWRWEREENNGEQREPSLGVREGRNGVASGRQLAVIGHSADSLEWQRTWWLGPSSGFCPLWSDISLRLKEGRE